MGIFDKKDNKPNTNNSKLETEIPKIKKIVVIELKTGIKYTGEYPGDIFKVQELLESFHFMALGDELVNRDLINSVKVFDKLEAKLPEENKSNEQTKVITFPEGGRKNHPKKKIPLSERFKL